MFRTYHLATPAVGRFQIGTLSQLDSEALLCRLFCFIAPLVAVLGRLPGLFSALKLSGWSTANSAQTGRPGNSGVAPGLTRFLKHDEKYL